jgi:hypothetical protein
LKAKKECAQESQMQFPQEIFKGNFNDLGLGECTINLTVQRSACLRCGLTYTFAEHAARETNVWCNKEGEE